MGSKNLIHNVTVSIDDDTFKWLQSLDEPISIFVRKRILAYRKRLEIVRKEYDVNGKFLILPIDGNDSNE